MTLWEDCRGSTKIEREEIWEYDGDSHVSTHFPALSDGDSGDALPDALEIYVPVGTDPSDYGCDCTDADAELYSRIRPNELRNGSGQNTQALKSMSHWSQPLASGLMVKSTSTDRTAPKLTLRIASVTTSETTG